jgi:hypothetical protein
MDSKPTLLASLELVVDVGVAEVGSLGSESDVDKFSLLRCPISVGISVVDDLE